ncbi:MAG: sporulation protein [Clostridia bacterium]|nr:sporulation protein [Clostridia bacterium]
MAVAPIQNVRRVVDYALTRISRRKIFLGVPTYGYDWTLPYERGNPGAPSLSPVEAVDLARRYGAEIQFDETAKSPWFRYTDDNGNLHEVWFEDARSIQAKLDLAREYNLLGIGYWNSMREFPQNWVVLNNEYNIIENPQII